FPNVLCTVGISIAGQLRARSANWSRSSYRENNLYNAGKSLAGSHNLDISLVHKDSHNARFSLERLAGAGGMVNSSRMGTLALRRNRCRVLRERGFGGGPGLLPKRGIYKNPLYPDDLGLSTKCSW